MTYTLGTLRRLGLENEFRELVKRFIPKTTNDQEAAHYIEVVISVAEKDGLVGTAMMRQMAHMRINQAVEPGLYGEIIKLHKRAAEGMRKKADKEEKEDRGGAVGDTTEDAKEAVETPEAEEAEESKEAEDEDERKGEEEDGGGAEEEEEAEGEEEEGSAKVDELEFEGITYLSAPHPLKPKALAKYGNDFLFPVPPGRIWKYKTAIYKSFLSLTQEPRTLKKHFRSCSRRGVTKAQFDKAMKFWEKEGKKLGWVLVEVRPDEVQLQPMKPIA